MDTIKVLNFIFYNTQKKNKNALFQDIPDRPIEVPGYKWAFIICYFRDINPTFHIPRDGPHPNISDSLFSLIIFIYVMVTFLWMFYGFCWREPEPEKPPPPFEEPENQNTVEMAWE